MTSMYRRVGALKLPATPATVTETLAPLDPGRDVLLGLFKQALISELSAAWTIVSAGTALASTDVVQDTWPGELTPEIVRTRVCKWPLLSVHRTGDATIEQHTLEIDRITQEWAVDYILGPLAAEDQRRLKDVLAAVPKVLLQTFRRRGHPDFDGGALQFFEGKGHFASVRMTGYQIGSAPFAGDDQPLYHATTITLETTETDGGIAGTESVLEGASFAIGLEGDGGTLPGALLLDTEVPVSALNPPE